MTTSQKPGNQAHLLLRRGLVAARAGNYSKARRWFRVVLDTDPDNITALLWLAWLAPTRQESLALLSHVLELDPENERARAGIRWARRRPAYHEDEESPSRGPERPGRSDFLGDALHSPQAQEKARNAIVAHRARKLMGPFGLLLAIAGCLFLVGLALIAWYSPSVVLAWMLPTTTPAMTSLPTLAANLPASPTPTSTLTPPSTYTPSPPPTAPPSKTATATPTPSPTATPTIPPPPPPTNTPVPANPPSAKTSSDKWIDVDLTHQRVTAYEGNRPVFQATVSTGLPNTPTVVGQFHIYQKLLAADMAGPGYYLPGVPYTMYFHGGYALHGTYWHNNFGQPMSHGCVNLRTGDAEWLFSWADPPLPAGASHVRSSASDPGTLVVVHY